MALCETTRIGNLSHACRLSGVIASEKMANNRIIKWVICEVWSHIGHWIKPGDGLSWPIGRKSHIEEQEFDVRLNAGIQKGFSGNL
jgi:hypothetical protein